MNERLLKIIIYTAGVVCLYAFIAVRVPVLFNAVLEEKIIPEYWENTKYGELYYFNFINKFQEEGLPKYAEKYRFTDRHPTLDKADMILFGDSFFDFTRMETFPERLGDTLNQSIYYARDDTPMQYLGRAGFENTEEKIILFESAERYIPTRFTEPHTEEVLVDPRGGIRKAVGDIRDFIFVPESQLLYGTLLSRSYFTTGLFSLSATFKFNTFKYITDMTPKYSLEEDTPWLFYHDALNGEPSSFYYQHTEEEISTYCNNIADLADKLYNHYHLKMVFMGIPSKYTINHTIINDDPYNNFLPRLYAGLEERGIPTISLYEDYIDNDEVLYYGTDTHWNPKGQSIAIEKAVEELEKTLLN